MPEGSTVGWYLPLAAGVAPVLVTGFAASAVADRLIFLAWGGAVAVGYAAGLRAALGRDWSRRRVGGLALLWLAGGYAAFGLLLAAHREAFDLGFRALLPDFYHAYLSRPAAPGAVATALAVTGLVLLAGSRGTKEAR